MTDREKLEKIVKGRDECWHDLVKMKNLFMEHVKDEDLSDEAVKLLAKVMAAEISLKLTDYLGLDNESS